MHPIHVLIDLAGYVGAMFVLSTYAATTTGRMATTSRRYLMLNVLGGSLLIVNCVALAAWPSAGVNVVWVGISLLSLVQAAIARAAARRGRAYDLGAHVEAEIAEQLHLVRSS